MKTRIICTIIFLISILNLKHVKSQISNFPWTENFNNVTFPPIGWTNIQTAGLGSNSVWSRVSAGTTPYCSPSEPGVALFDAYNFMGGTTALLITPAMNLPTDSYQVRFWMFRDNLRSDHHDLLNVYYNTAPNISFANLLGSIDRYYGNAPNVNNANQWYQYSFNLPPGSDGLGYIIFEGASDFGYRIFIDDIEIAPQTTCISPTGLTISSLNTNNANLSWIGIASNYIIRYRNLGSTNWNYATTTDTTYLFNALIAGTSYEAQVKALCSSIDSSAWSSSSIRFSTLCETVNVPYFENFDNVSASVIPQCIMVANTNQDSYYWETSSEVSHSYPNCIKVRFNSTLPTNDWFFTRGLNLEVNKTYKLKFFYKAGDSAFPEKLEVKYGNNPNESAMTCGQLFNNESLILTEYDSAISSFSVPVSGEYYIGFHCYSNANMYLVRIDDISVTEILNCSSPTALTSDNITPNSADIHWIHSASLFNVRYRTTGETIWTVINTSNTNLSLTGLTANTQYEFQIQAVCSATAGDTSAWATAVTFTTLDNVLTCNAPTALVDSAINAAGASLNWINGGNETAWNLKYRKSIDTNYIHLNNISTKPYILNGLEQNTSYIWNLQAICNNNNTSYWSTGNSFNTAVSVAENLFQEMNVYSNNNQIHIINSNNQHVKEIIVYDMLGQEVGTYAINSTDNILINSNLTIGNYVVKVITETKVGNYKLFIK